MLFKPLIEALRYAWSPLYVQNDFVIANAPGSSVRADLNSAYQSLATLSSGAAAPSTTYAHMLWADTTAGVLKKRNAANSGWIVVRTLDESLVLSRSSNTILGVSDIGKTIAATASFTQTFTAAATLGDGWWCSYYNASTGAITLDPNGAELIDGLTTLVLSPGERVFIFCAGTSFVTIGKTTGLKSITLSAVALTPRQTIGCALLAFTNGAGGQPDIPYLAFDGAANEFACFWMRMPKSWDQGAVYAAFCWRRASGTGAANVVWGIRGLAVSDNDTPITTFSANSLVTDDAKTTLANFAISDLTAALTIAGSPAEGDLVFFEVLRNAANAADTLDAVDAWLTEVTLYYNVKAMNDG